MIQLFSKEKAIFLVENPTKIGFSWWFFFAGIAMGYCMHKWCGDSKLIIMIFEKYLFISLSIIFWVPRRLIDKRVRAGVIAKESTLIYGVLPAGYVSTFIAAMWFTHMFFGFKYL